MKTCSVEGCDKPHRARGVCSTHYPHLRKREGLVQPQGPLHERLWKRVEKTDTCWLWTGAKAPGGHGRIGDNSKRSGWSLTHRVAYELEYGEIPEGAVIRHLCNVPDCVRPDHLAVGTPRDNSRDASRAERTRARKLTGEDVRTIRALRESGESQRELARRYDVSPRTIKLAAEGSTWRHLSEDNAPCPTCGRPWD